MNRSSGLCRLTPRNRGRLQAGSHGLGEWMGASRSIVRASSKGCGAGSRSGRKGRVSLCSRLALAEVHSWGAERSRMASREPGEIRSQSRRHVMEMPERDNVMAPGPVAISAFPATASAQEHEERDRGDSVPNWFIGHRADRPSHTRIFHVPNASGRKSEAIQAQHRPFRPSADQTESNAPPRTFLQADRRA
jgi:hypothetical protein